VNREVIRCSAGDDQIRTHSFKEAIKPLLSDPLVEFIGEIGDDAKADFLGNGAGLLFSIDWPEPFGLVMIEAMACGTPVIAWSCGAVPEVIDHGTTGFIVRSMVSIRSRPRIPPLVSRFASCIDGRNS
jgi:glycosyltransferase involved in cell wall biosynthesis